MTDPASIIFTADFFLMFHHLQLVWESTVDACMSVSYSQVEDVYVRRAECVCACLCVCVCVLVLSEASFQRRQLTLSSNSYKTGALTLQAR